MIKKTNIVRDIIILFLCFTAGFQVYKLISQYLYEKAVLQEIVTRLEADSRVAEVLVVGVNYNETDQKSYTTIKFLEYDSRHKPLEPKYFTFPGNIIQFQSLVVRFDDMYVREAHPLKGKSAYLFWKVFMLDGKDTKEYTITEIYQVPRGYKLEARAENPVETRFWGSFWEYVLNPTAAQLAGVKNAQIEAPGTMFVPGIVYTIKIEHDGGLRIDTALLAPIVRGEKIP